MENKLTVHVLMRASKKTGRVDTCMTGLGAALLNMWGLQNTTKTKRTLVIERDTGKVISVYTGTADGMPKVEQAKKKDLGTCEEYGIPLEMLQEIKDARFDKMEV